MVPNPTDPTMPIEIWSQAPVGLPAARSRRSRRPTEATHRRRRPGTLDFDSNAACVIDGRRQENVIFTQTPPPPGEYIVRVDAFSLCGQAAAQWRLEVNDRPTARVVNPATWEATDADTRGAHGAGAGRLAVHVYDSESTETQQEGEVMNSNRR